MGLRAKRRLVVGTALALTVAAGIVAFAVTRPGSSSPARSSKLGHKSAEVFGTFGSFGITYGLTQDELAARVGQPFQKRNGCWTYRVHGGTFAGVSIPSQLGTVDAVRFCFFSGGVATIGDHWRQVNGRDPYGHPWVPPVTFGCGGGPCHPSQRQ